MKDSYGKLIVFRCVTVLINIVVLSQITIPLDLMVLVAGIWVKSPGIRVAIVVLEILNLMLAALGGFFGNIIGAAFGILVSGICLWAICQPDVKQRFGDL